MKGKPWRRLMPLALALTLVVATAPAWFAEAVSAIATKPYAVTVNTLGGVGGRNNTVIFKDGVFYKYIKANAMDPNNLMFNEGTRFDLFAIQDEKSIYRFSGWLVNQKPVGTAHAAFTTGNEAEGYLLPGHDLYQWTAWEQGDTASDFTTFKLDVTSVGGSTALYFDNTVNEAALENTFKATPGGSNSKTYRLPKDLPVTLQAVADPGYTFEGWYDGAGTLVTKDFIHSIKIYKNVSYRAVFSKEVPKVTVTYHLKGGSGNQPAEQAGAAGDIITVAEPMGINKPGYTFAGWTLTPNGAGKVYAPGETVVLPASAITLYAFWLGN